jgi:WD40 repeat protein
MRVLSGHHGSVYALAYSPDGSALASAGDDQTIRLWRVQTGEQDTPLRGHTGAVLALAYAPDGRALISGGHDRRTLLWDLGTHSSTVLNQSRYPVVAVAASPDGHWLACGHDHGRGRAPLATLLLFDRASQRHLPREWYREYPSVWALTFGPDGSLAVALSSGDVSLWDLRAMRERRLRHTVAVRALAFSPDGSALATSPGTPVEVWDLATDTVRLRPGDTGKPIAALAFHPDGRSLATGCWASTVRLWDARTGAEHARYDWRLGRIHAVAIAPDGMTAAAAGDSGDVLIWDLDF